MGPLALTLEMTRVESPADAFAFRFEAQAYTLRTAGGGRAEFRVEWGRELLADLEALRLPGRDPALVQRVGEALRRCLEPAGWRELGASVAAELAAGRTAEVTIRSNAAELYALPWELLALPGAGVLLGRAPGVRLRYEWPETTTCPERPAPRPEGGRILVAWSAAGGDVPAAAHVQAIRDACERGHPLGARGCEVLAHASTAAIQEALVRAERAGEPFAALHLLCHGGRAGSTFGLVLDVADGPEQPPGPVDRPRSATIDAGSLRDLLAPLAGSLRLVVLAACDGGNAGPLGNHLGSVAQALHRAGLQSVVAARYPLSVAGSITLARALYRVLLVETGSIEQALAEARAALALDVAELDWAALQLHARVDGGPAGRPIVFRPFRGLLTFTAEHVRFFFGRDAERAEILGDLAALVRGGRPRLTVVAGASGSGKSSVVLAGTATDLCAAGPGVDAALRHERPWEVQVLRPGREPIAALERALAARDPARPLLLVVDQFEELFTHTEDPGRRQAFARRLWDLAQGTGGVHAVLTLRVDFIGRCGELVLDDAGLRLDRVAYDEAHRIFVAQMSSEQLRRAIEGPAARAGLGLQEGLVARMLADVDGEPGALPVLQYTLDRLWQRREGHLLTMAAYEEIGGVIGALQQQADALVEALPADSLAQARRLLTRLVDFGDEAGVDTRRRVQLAALRPAGGAFELALQRLLAARLIVLADEGGQATVEVAHEALIRKWTRLRGWVREDRLKLAELTKLEQWAALRREHGTLLRGAQLGYAEEVARRWPDDLDASASSLLAESRRRAVLERRLRLAGIAALAVVAVLFAVLGWWGLERAAEAEASEKEARDTVAIAEARRLAGLVSGQDPSRHGLDVLLAVEAARGPLDRGLAVPGDVLTRLARMAGRTWPHHVLGGHDGAVTAVDFGADGRFFTLDGEFTLRIWRSEGDAPPALERTLERILQAQFSPDGRTLATSGVSVQVWPGTGQGAALADCGERFLPHAAFSADGRSLLVMEGEQVRVCDTRDGSTTATLTGHTNNVEDAAFSPDGRWVVTGADDESAILWPLEGAGEPRVFAHQDRADLVGTVAFSPDGRRFLAFGLGPVIVRSLDGDTAQTIDPGDPTFAAVFDRQGAWVVTRSAKGMNAWFLAQPEQPFGGGDRDTGSVTHFAYSDDGRMFLTAGDDGTARIWRDAHSPDRALLVLNGHSGPIRAAAISPDGTRVLTGSEDRTARLWRLDATGEPRVFPVDATTRAVFDPAGARVAVGSGIPGEPGVVSVWPTEGEGPPLELRGLDAPNSVAWSPGGDRIAGTSWHGTAMIWRADGSGEPVALHGHDGEARAARFSPDGRRLVTAAADRTLRVWDATSGETLKVLTGHEGTVVWFAFTGDGRIVSASPRQQALRVWPADGAGEPVVLAGMTTGPQIPLSADGRLVVLVEGATARVHRTDGTGEPVVLSGHADEVTCAAFSRDAQRIATGSTDTTVRVWPADGAGPPRVLAGHAGTLLDVEFSPDGRWLAGVAPGEVRVWPTDGAGPPLVLDASAGGLAFHPRSDALLLDTDRPRLVSLDPARMIRHACAYAGRNLTRLEWGSAMPEAPYRRTCDEWPEDPAP